ncbi:MAG: acyl-CoA thioesterase [Hyphomicrobiaceae bacterium]
MLVSQRVVQIEWGDCDPANIVFYPRYFAWFDASTAHHFTAAGLPKTKLISRYGVIGFPMVDTRAVFHEPSRHGDEVTIETRFPKFGRSSFEVHHRLQRKDGSLGVEAFEKRVLVRPAEEGADRLRPFAIPLEVIDLFK